MTVPIGNKHPSTLKNRIEERKKKVMMRLLLRPTSVVSAAAMDTPGRNEAKIKYPRTPSTFCELYHKKTRL